MTSIRTLHIINKRPDHPGFRNCLSALAREDALLLTENGVLALVDDEVILPGHVYALAADLQARAMAIPEQGVGTEAIGYDDMVALTARAERVISW